MPNWCAGTLRVRGTKENLTKFVLEGLQSVDYIGEDLEALKMDEYSHVECSRCWIKGTRRGFILDLDEYIDDWNDEGKIAIGLEAEFAWGISSEELLNSCKQYGVDMRIHAFECGMCFNQIIEIIDEEVKFDDYNWDCICPNVGG
nr:hypothetical protein [Catenibacterium mitsuokai]